MDKYLLVLLIFMVGSIPIAFIEPTTGEFKDPPRLELFYGALAGIVIIVFYNGYKEKKAREKANAKRRSRK